jgi:hypothetical protein
MGMERILEAVRKLRTIGQGWRRSFNDVKIRTVPGIAAQYFSRHDEKCRNWPISPDMVW